jgi:hypothetical protein
MSLPVLNSTVILRIPDREVLSAYVTRAGHGWLDLELEYTPRTPLSFLEHRWVFVEYVDPNGLVRIMGQIEPSPDAPYLGPTVLRFTHREVVQLLRRREYAGGTLHARASLIAVAPDAVAHGTETVAVGSGEFAVRDLPGAAEGDLYDFAILPGGNEPPVTGRAEVTSVGSLGHVVLSYVSIAAFERDRLARLLSERQR